MNADRSVITRHRELIAGAHRPGSHRQHLVRDPKLWLISTPPLLDRILHQAMVAELEPTYARGYVDHSFACLPGRGPQRAAILHLRWMREHRYRLALDIRRAYLRYLDDFVLFGDDAARLEAARTEIEGWLAEHRGLALNPKRWHVSETSQPCTYLGQRVSRAGLSVGKKLKRRMPGRVRAAAQRGEDALVRSVRSYVGLATFG